MIKTNLAFVNDKKMKKVKKKWFGGEETTDVVAFPLKEDLPDGTYLLGEIVINLDQAKKQARQYRVSLEEEIARLAAHGALHLLGSSDTDEESQRRMKGLEDNIVTKSLKRKT